MAKVGRCSLACYQVSECTLYPLKQYMMDTVFAAYLGTHFSLNWDSCKSYCPSPYIARGVKMYERYERAFQGYYYIMT